MIVLGLDTATQATAVALLLDDGRALERDEDPPDGGRPGHATRVLPLAAELLDETGLDWREIERIAVGVGPGSFTGLRIGVATARGLAQSLGISVGAVGTLRALAVAAAASPDATPDPPTILAVLDARRGELFVAAYAGDRELLAPRAVAPQQLGALIAELPSRPALAVGDGAIKSSAQLHAAAVAVAPVTSRLHRVSAAVVCRLAAAAPPTAPEAVLPHYHRLADAEIALQSNEP